ncbi:30 kDa heat shock protein [Talaromyces pinophilus]|nr:30 kDa heat shock protein [Talaromyces pinophilus]
MIKRIDLGDSADNPQLRNLQQTIGLGLMLRLPAIWVGSPSTYFNHPQFIKFEQTNRLKAATSKEAARHSLPAKMRRLSGLQREVLSLYRKCLREVRKKPEDARANFRAFAQRTFRQSNIYYAKATNSSKHIRHQGLEISTVTWRHDKFEEGGAKTFYELLWGFPHLLAASAVPRAYIVAYLIFDYIVLTGSIYNQRERPGGCRDDAEPLYSLLEIQTLITFINPTTIHTSNNLLKNQLNSDEMAFYTTTLSPGDFLPLFQLMDDYCDTRRPTKPAHSSRGKPSAAPAAPSAPATPAKPQLVSFTPKFDVREADQFYILDGELPGAQQENIEIEFTDPETLVIKGQIERNYDITSPSSAESIKDNDDVMSIHSDGASSTHSNYHSPTVEDEDEDGAVKVNTVQSTSVAKHQPQPEVQQPTYKYWASERSIGTFQRTFTFPTRVNQDGVKATFKNGILSVFVPKQAIQKAKRIRID